MTKPSTPSKFKGKRCVFTICTKSYIGLAEALGTSLHDNGGGADFHIIVVDHDVSDITSKVATIVPAKDFCGFTQEEWTQQTFKYDLVEFCTSIKARSFLRFLDRGYDNLVYLDPDILIFDDMGQIFASLENHDVVVTPHRLDIDHDIPSRGGLFNLGFLAIRNNPRARRMLQWWDSRLLNHSINDAARGLFTDQKWMDNLPLMIPTHRLAVMDDPGMNLAPWNLHERDLKQEGKQVLVRLRAAPDDWRPVSFVHYSAFNYGELASGIIGEATKKICARSKGFDLLVNELMERLAQSRFIELQDIAYEFATYSDGLPIHPGHRRIYARLQAEGKPLVDPFNAHAEFYQALKLKGMLVKSAPKKNGSGAGSTRQVDRIVTALDLISRLAIRTMGYDRYFLLSKFLIRYLHPVNHARLLNTKESPLDVEYF